MIFFLKNDFIYSVIEATFSMLKKCSLFFFVPNHKKQTDTTFSCNLKDIFLYQYVPKCKFKGQKKHDFLEQREHLEKQSSAWFLQSDKKFFPL